MFAQTRGIVPEAVVQARPRPKVAGATPGARYQAVGDAATASIRQSSAARQVGVTVWRLRAAAPGDSGARILVQEGGEESSNTVEWVPERVGINTGLREGDRVRLTIESPDAGYLYVIDRERYSSGERGMPYLIFPTSRTRSGDNRGPASLTLSSLNFGAYPMANGLSRLATRFLGEPDSLERSERSMGEPLDAERAAELGLVTAAYDEVDWDEEVRLALEERASFSPDALTGLEANLRFAGPETMETKIFGRLTAWQNWIFSRPNAAAQTSALKRYGSGLRPSFDPKRT
jgi:hypothetical protein